ncbi:hypothetical protein FDUTEX481_03828 [Tolypothrix sp. PCC 7601]|nr:hypothetical protein FDUTEX481_03828 [Tolypothrix sp. PCC 7601]
MIGYSETIIGYPETMIGYPEKMIRYLETIIEYPETIIGYLETIFRNSRLLKKAGGRGHWCQLNVKPALLQGFALTPSPSPTESYGVHRSLEILPGREF